MANTRLVSIEEGAVRLGTYKGTVYKWAESGKIPSVKLGRRRLIPEEYLDSITAYKAEA